MKPLLLIFRHPRQAAVLGLIAAAGLLAGCTGTDYSSYVSSEAYGNDYSYGGVGVYDSWGYYGNPYYGYGGGAVIVTAPVHPSHPIARPR